MPKPEGLFAIGEIAVACGVSVNALRFYETKLLIKPAHIDPESGYRYYSRENLLRLRTVLKLKDAGLSLPEIKEYLDGGQDRYAKIAALEKRRAMLSLAIEDLKIRNTRHGDLSVCELTLPERLCLCRTIYAKDGQHALLTIGEFYDELIRKGVPISHAWPEFCEYPDDGLLKGEFRVTDFVITACLPVDKQNLGGIEPRAQHISPCEIAYLEQEALKRQITPRRSAHKNAPAEAVFYPSSDAVAVNYRGSYYELWRAYEALGRHIDERGYTPSGYPQEIYLETEADGSVRLDSGHNVTRVIVPIKRGE